MGLGIATAHLAGPLHINIQHHIASFPQPALQWSGIGAVVLTVHLSPFNKSPDLNSPYKLFTANKMIILAGDFPWSRRPRGTGYGKTQIRV
jgi:hypothetical protein